VSPFLDSAFAEYRGTRESSADVVIKVNMQDLTAEATRRAKFPDSAKNQRLKIALYLNMR
jgi:hypothetical protein